MTTTFTYSNSFSNAGAGINGLTVNAYMASRFSGVPALGASPPSGSPDATTTTGSAAGFNGAFSIALPTSEDYYVSVSYLGTLYWIGPVYGVFADGVAQGGTAGPGSTAPQVVAQAYAGASTDVVASRQLATDLTARWEALGDGRQFSGPGTAPVTYGTHNAGAVGTGQDFLIGMEAWQDVAHGRQYSFPKIHMTDGTHWLTLAGSAIFPLSGSPNLIVSSTAGLASSGTLRVYSVTLGSPTGVGTIHYTSIVDGTHLGGCTSTGLTTSADVTQRYSDWITDSFGAPILWIANFGGLYVNDNINFRYAGVFPDNNYDITIAFLDDVNRNTGSAIIFGADNTTQILRSNDGFGNSKLVFKTNGSGGAQVFTLDAAGWYSSQDVPLGNTNAPWSALWIDGTGGSGIQFGNDGFGQITRTNVLGNNQLNFTADTKVIVFDSAAGFFPSAAIGLGTSSNRWAGLNIQSLNMRLQTKTASYTTLGSDGTIELTGTTAAQTLTLGTTSFAQGQIQAVKNASTQTWTVAAASGTTDVTQLLAGQSIIMQFDGTNWVLLADGSAGAVQIGQQAAFNSVTSNYTAQPTGTSSWLQADTTSGTAPSITLPNDGKTYRVEFTASYWKAGTLNDTCAIGLGVDATHVVAASTMFVNNIGSVLPNVVIPQVVGSGQTIKVFTANVTGSGASHLITVGAGTGGASLTTLSSLAAYRAA